MIPQNYPLFIYVRADDRTYRIIGWIPTEDPDRSPDEFEPVCVGHNRPSSGTYSIDRGMNIITEDPNYNPTLAVFNE